LTKTVVATSDKVEHWPRGDSNSHVLSDIGS
jgi:hypothetical protein